MAVCLVGTRWGSYLGTRLRKFYAGPLYVCGRDSVRTSRFARSLRADGALTGWESAVRHPEVTGLILAIPTVLHRQAAVAALNNGKHVLVEKPLAPTVEDCDAMIRAAQSAGVVLAAGENVPFRPSIVAARNLLPSIGERRLFYASALHRATDTNDLSGGILIDYSVHYIRAVRELYGEPDRVYAVRAHGGKAREDNVTLTLSSNTGWQATLALSWQASAGRHPEFIITGTRGAIKIWPENTSVDLYPVEPTALTRAISKIRPDWLQEWLRSPETQRRRYKLPGGDRMGYQTELRTFLDAVNRGEPDIASALEARRDVEIALAARASLHSGNPVECSAEPCLQVA